MNKTNKLTQKEEFIKSQINKERFFKNFSFFTDRFKCEI